MRSDRNKKADPARDIDDFLSRFDDIEAKETDSFGEYTEEEQSKPSVSSGETFHWKEIEANKPDVKSKADSLERVVIKDPAPSSIKVERRQAERSAYVLEAVEPQRASDYNKDFLDELFEENAKATEPETEPPESEPEPVPVIEDKQADTTASDLEAIVSEIASDNIHNAPEELPEEHGSFFKKLFSFFGGKSDKPADVIEPAQHEMTEAAEAAASADDAAVSDSAAEQKATDRTKEFDELFGIGTADNEEDIGNNIEDNKKEEAAIESVKDADTESNDISNEISDEALSTDSVTASDFAVNNDSDPVIDHEAGFEYEEIPDTEAYDAIGVDAKEETAAVPAAAISAAAAPVVFDLGNTPKVEISPVDSGYIRNDETGEHIKIDRGKRKRIAYSELAAGSSKKAGVRGGKKSRAKKAKKPKERKTLGQRLFMRKNPKYDPSQGAAYVRDGKTVKNKAWRFSFLKLIRDFVVIGVLMLLAAVGVGAYVIYHAPQYNYNDIYATVATTSIVYDDEEKQIDNIYYTENRRLVKYDEMPEDLINAFVAIEDKTFWKHHGFNWIRMVGAVFSSITGHGQISGTSTITQQLSRNVYLPEEKSERTIKRKFLEMYYAARIEHALSKEQIIEAYLNTIYLGHGCYGVNSAARTYFSKSVKKLDLVECASLAALPQAPHNYSLLKYANEGGELSEDSKVVQKSPDKVVTNDISRERRNLTLDLMLEQELITKAEYDKAYDKPLNDFINPNLKSGSGNYSYFHEYLIDTIIADLMEQKNMTEENAERLVYTGGLQIYSTLDSKAQNVVANEFKDGSNFPDVSAIWRQDSDGNILNNDGKIALYDYEDYFDSKDNFTLRSSDDDIKFHDDGSATIYADRNLNIYETEVDGAVDYSIEFKNYYVYEDGIVYSIQGGYVNIPSAYKSGDGNGNVIVSADFFNDEKYKKAFKKKGGNLIIKEAGYSIGQKIRQPQGGMVIVKVGTGEVKAMVGGRQFKGQRLLNRATNPRQPGSSIKPLAVYGAALQKSYELAKDGKKWTYTDYKIDRQGTKGWGDYVTVHSSIEDERTRINGKYWPLNASRTYTGKNNFRTAIQMSINTCAVKLVYQLTPEYSIKQVRKFGITTAVDVDDNKKVNDVNPAAMGLGAMTQGVTPLEMALAYAAFPGGGKVNTPICYTKILDRNGNVLLEGKSEQKRALNSGVAWIMTDVLQSVVTRGIAGAAAISEVQSGGKTGTTNDNYDIWFDGFTPNYAAALWIGTDNNIEMSGTSYTAAALWSRIMDQIPKAKKGSYKKMPSNVVEKWGDYYTEGTENGLSSWSYAEMKKKARDAAYRKWKAQRENHRHWVVDKKPQAIIEKVYIKESQVSKYADKKLYRDKKGIYYERDSGKKTKEEGHWEYDKGWRDGDFRYTFDGQSYSD